MIPGIYAPDTYNGNGTTTVFAITFEFLSSSTNIRVSLKDTTTGVVTLQTLTTDYTISGSNVTFVTAPASGKIVLIELALNQLQETDYREYDLFPAASHETALDKLTLQGQVTKAATDRSLKVDAAVEGFSATIVGTPAAGQVPMATSATAIAWTDAVDADLLTLGTGVATFLATPSSANLAAAVTNETGSGALVFGTGPTIASPTITGTAVLTGAAVTDGTFNNPTLTSAQLGTPDSGTLTNCTGLPEAGLTLADNTTNNASTSNHGFLKKLSNVSTEFMNGQGNWATPASSGGAWTLISTGTASSSAQVDFTGLSSAYATYAVVFSAVVPATNGSELDLRTSTDGGSTYDAGSGNYVQANFYSTQSVGATSFGSGSVTAISMSGGASNTATHGGISGFIMIGQPSNANRCLVTGQSSYYSGGLTSHVLMSISGARVAAADVDAIRFKMDSGNIASGTFKLYGIN